MYRYWVILKILGVFESSTLTEIPNTILYTIISEYDTYSHFLFTIPINTMQQ